jgi:sigma-B regulation protein RsbU (phosphoserine phosphatase)
VFSQLNFAQGVLAAFLVVGSLLLLVELVSFILGFSLTRTITQAVHNLYEGTQRVRGGDFSHRIAVQGNDQLAELGRSFNGMTENLERLIVVEKEQERLKSEIEIAREVQNQLFPREAPTMKTLELTGVCHPARMVSGDYYDFVRLGDTTLALAIGDVAGKGISAALLMAALQSIMRTQLSAGIPVHAAAHGGNGGGHAVFSAAELVSQLNKQVYANTAPEKYATFYFGLYDDESRMLTYTNAGHLPPILMRDGHAQHLEVTGTVVGAFPSVTYEEKSLQLRRGDLLVGFTDGIVEPENEYGEAFGEERLVDLLRRYGQRESKEIIARVMETVEQWTGTSELFDDMTLLLARGV